MKVELGGKRLTLGDKTRIGIGGEAEVHRHRDLALKVFYTPAARARDAASRALRAALRLKREKLRRFPSALPPLVVAPRALLHDLQGQVCGYAMPLVPDAEHAGALMKRRGRDGVVDNNQVFGLFRQIYLALEALHGRDVVVGDLNDGNVLTTRDAAARPGSSAQIRPHLIDADSMQWDDLPCIVGHERTLDPYLYGHDLSARPCFTPETDWYAFAVQLFSVLLYVHPYGGVHPDYRTLLRRAEAGVSVLRDDVQRPRTAADPAVMPDDLRDYFAAIFDRQRRGKPPAALLEARWTRCSCGVEHARRACPGCSATAQVPALPQPGRPLQALLQTGGVPAHAGRCEAVRLVGTAGRIFAATVQGSLRYLVYERGELRRENGARVLAGEIGAEMAFAVSGATTWVGRRGELVALEGGAAVARASTATFAARPAFAANSTACYRVAGNWLVESIGPAAGAGGGPRREQRIGQVLDGQTFIAVGERSGVGFYRVGPRLTRAFVWRCGRPGLVDVALPAIEGRLVDAAACFDARAGSALLAVVSERGGREHTALTIIGADGRVVAAAAGPSSDGGLLAGARGKALGAGRVLAASDGGLVAARVDRHSGALVVERTFDDAAPFVSGDVELLPGAGGSLYVVTTKDITQLSLRA